MAVNREISMTLDAPRSFPGMELGPVSEDAPRWEIDLAGKTDLTGLNVQSIPDELDGEVQGTGGHGAPSRTGTRTTSPGSTPARSLPIPLRARSATPSPPSGPAAA